MGSTSTRASATVAEGPRDHEVRRSLVLRSRRRRLAALGLTLVLVGACGDEGQEDLSPTEPEAGENDTEVVPGEEGPVD